MKITTSAKGIWGWVRCLTQHVRVTAPWLLQWDLGNWSCGWFMSVWENGPYQSLSSASQTFAAESPELKIWIAGPTPESISVGVGGALINCISNKSPGNADKAAHFGNHWLRAPVPLITALGKCLFYMYKYSNFNA